MLWQKHWQIFLFLIENVGCGASIWLMLTHFTHNSISQQKQETQIQGYCTVVMSTDTTLWHIQGTQNEEEEGEEGVLLKAKGREYQLGHYSRSQQSPLTQYSSLPTCKEDVGMWILYKKSDFSVSALQHSDIYKSLGRKKKRILNQPFSPQFGWPVI